MSCVTRILQTADNLKMECVKNEYKIKKEVLSSGTEYKTSGPGSKVVFHFQTHLCDNDRTIIDDSRNMGKPMELVLGKKFKLEVWETIVQAMAINEVAKFTVDKSLVVSYPFVSKTLRDAGKPNTQRMHCCGTALQAEGIGYEDLNKLIKEPCDLEFIIELLKVENSGEYEEESWQLTEEQKLKSVPYLREEGNDLYRKHQYVAAADKYAQAIGYLEQLMLKEKPHDIEWTELNNLKLPLLLNYAQCKLQTEEYYAVIEHCSTVLESDPGKVPVEHSRLSLSFPEMIKDKLAFSYFSQFMEIKGYAVLLNLWLDIQQLCSNCAPISGSSREEQCKLNSVFKKSYARSSSSDRSERDSDSRMGGRTIRGRCSSDSGERTSTVSAIVQKIWQRYLSDNATFCVKVPEDLRSKFYEDMSNEDNGSSFKQLYDHVLQCLKKDLWNDFVHSEWFCKYQVEVLTSGTVELSDIIYHPSALTCFSEFLDQEGYLSVLEFWQMGTSFEKNLLQAGDSFDAAQAQNDAVVIYDKYLSLQATSPLGIDHVTRCEVEQGICMESCAPRPDCFRPALHTAWMYLSIVCLQAFLSSQNYVQLLSELMRASRNTSSPASSVTDVSIDSRSKHDPDMIWRRRHHNRGLSIGRIDQLGRFETEIEPEPDKKSESRISRVVKKLVNKDEDKAQEEMAWRIAEMIIKDVTNLTMGSRLDEDDNT